MDGKTYVDSIYCTIATFTTVGFGDVSPTSSAARLITIPFMILGVLCLPSAAVYLYEINLQRVKGMLMSEQKNHIVIIGDLPEMIKSIVKEINHTKDICIYSGIYNERPWDCVHFIKSNSLDKSSLSKAGVQRASDVIVACSDDEDTLLATALVRELSPNVNIIVTVVSDERAGTMQTVGANYIINTDTMIGRMLAGAVTEAPVIDLITDVTTSLSGHDIAQTNLSDFNSMVVSDLAREIREHKGTFLGIVRDGENIVNPPLEMTLKDTDTLLILW